MKTEKGNKYLIFLWYVLLCFKNYTHVHLSSSIVSISLTENKQRGTMSERFSGIVSPELCAYDDVNSSLKTTKSIWSLLGVFQLVA